MLPRPVVTVIVLLLTLGELVNIFGQVFLGAGDTAIHVMYPAVLGALGLTAARKTEPAPTLPGDDSPEAVEPDPDPVQPERDDELRPRRARHRYREEGRA